MLRKGQAAVEYVFLVCLILAFVLTIMMAGFRETELNLAVASTRLAVNNEIAGVDAYAGYQLKSVDYERIPNSRKICLKPSVIDSTGAAVPGSVFKTSILTAVAKAVTPGFQGPVGTGLLYCFPGASFEYCVSPDCPAPVVPLP